MKSEVPGQGSLYPLDTRVPYLDGLRGVAIGLVMLGHYFSDLYLFKGGWVGLNLFFILSGYLITDRLYAPGSPRQVLRHFFKARILRIFPLHYAVLIFFFVIIPLFIPALMGFVGALPGIQGRYWFYVSNWGIYFHGLPKNPLFFHFWSLAVEEQFYLLWPFLFLLMRDRKWRWILIAVGLIFSVVCRLLISSPLAAYVNTSTAMEPLLMGALVRMLAVYKPGRLFGKLTLFLAGLAICTLGFILTINPDLHISNAHLLRFGYTAIDIFWTSLLACLVFGRVSIKFKWFFNQSWLCFLGKYAYGLYVFHWIVLQLFVYNMHGRLGVSAYDPGILYFIIRLAGLGITLGLSLWSFHMLERPMLGLKHMSLRLPAPEELARRVILQFRKQWIRFR